MRRTCRAFPLIVAASLLGCASGKFEHPGALSAHALPQREAAKLPPDLQNLLGFVDPNARGDRPDPQVGDEVLYRAHLHNAGKAHDWYVRMKLVRAYAGEATLSFRLDDGSREQLTSPLWEAQVEVYDCENGNRVITKMGVADSSMTSSIRRQSEILRLHVGDGQTLADLSAEDRRDYLLGSGAISNLFNGWQENDELQPLMKEVIGFPTRAILGMLLRGSFSYTVSQDFAEDSRATVVLPSPVGEMAGERVPISINMGGVTLMHADLITVEPLGPLSISFGVTAIRGVHPSHADRWIEIELVGARSKAPR